MPQANETEKQRLSRRRNQVNFTLAGIEKNLTIQQKNVTDLGIVAAERALHHAISRVKHAREELYRRK